VKLLEEDEVGSVPAREPGRTAQPTGEGDHRRPSEACEPVTRGSGDPERRGLPLCAAPVGGEGERHRRVARAQGGDGPQRQVARPAALSRAPDYPDSQALLGRGSPAPRGIIRALRWAAGLLEADLTSTPRHLKVIGLRGACACSGRQDVGSPPSGGTRWRREGERGLCRVPKPRCARFLLGVHAAPGFESG
jgi:hypothetical protein